MRIYTVRITETCTYEVDVRAPGEDEALETAEEVFCETGGTWIATDERGMEIAA
ncbi:hypothetical protein [Streptomyces sp. NBC_01304]|uniref:hypothetical protein n=1 Tax=Streptomyces sp. NBC_01304 TaxID=2903818 RepID=UPI002E167821|nr:hypothetical protein OG430_44535 [Streptomyces sp. NBC_01304]